MSYEGSCTKRLSYFWWETRGGKKKKWLISTSRHHPLLLMPEIAAAIMGQANLLGMAKQKGGKSLGHWGCQWASKLTNSEPRTSVVSSHVTLEIPTKLCFLYLKNEDENTQLIVLLCRLIRLGINTSEMLSRVPDSKKIVNNDNDDNKMVNIKNNATSDCCLSQEE